jgi:eukaryotic-like serine/threonine-protein kinase
MEANIPSVPGYEILGELGHGGMGIVYKAEDLRNDRLVALKMILSGRVDDILELARFRIEAESIASLAHPNIVLIHEVGVHVGYPYFVLEYAEGRSLAEKIRSQPMPCDWTAHVCVRIALAMQHAHERGIIHRDLKSANVLLMSHDLPKVADFGLAKFTTAYNPVYMDTIIPIDFTRLSLPMGEAFERIKETTESDLSSSFEEFVVRTEWKRTFGSFSVEDEQRINGFIQSLRNALHRTSFNFPSASKVGEDLTKTGAIMGTPQYMAPEQAWGRTKEVGPSADIYSLGAIMYEMLTGRPPFIGDRFQVIEQVRSTTPISPRLLRDSINPDLEAICMKCLEKTVERRYQSMGSVADELQRFMDMAEDSARRDCSPSLEGVAPADDSGETTKISTTGLKRHA